MSLLAWLREMAKSARIMFGPMPRCPFTSCRKRVPNLEHHMRTVHAQHHRLATWERP